MRFASVWMICSVLLLLLVLVGIGVAQSDPAAGIIPFSTRVGGVYDSVDLATGNIVVKIPIINKTGKLPFSYSLVANSHVYYDAVDNVWALTVSNQGSFFGSNQGRFLGGQLRLGSPQLFWQYYTPQCPGCTALYLDNFYLVDSTGVTHLLNLPQTDYLCSNGTPPATMTPWDGTGYTVALNGFDQNTCNPVYTIYDKAGNAYPRQGNVVQDPDGAQITSVSVNNVNADTYTTTYTDTLGTTALISTLGEAYNAPNSGAPDIYQYTDAAGDTQTFKVNYSSYTVQTAFGCLGGTHPVREIGPGPGYLPSSVTTPTGTITFTYEPTPGYPANVTGRLASITYPTGGSVSYTYSGSNNGITCTNPPIVPTITRTVNDGNEHMGTWTYVNSTVSGSGTVTGTDATGNQTVYTFFGEFQTQAQYYQGSASGTPLKTIATYYNKCYVLSTCKYPGPLMPGPGVPVTETDVYSSFNNSTSNLVQTMFDSYSNPIEVRKYDFGAAIPPTGSPISDTVTSYGQSWNGKSCAPYSAGYIVNTACYQHTMNSSGSDVTETQVTYSSTGHPTSTADWAGGSSWLTSTAGYNANGTMAWLKDPRGNQATFSYTGSGGCNSLLLTQTTYPLSSVGSDSQTWNCNLGLKLTHTDVNHETTTYRYNDPFWRMTEVDYPDGGLETYAYTDTTPNPYSTHTTKITANITLVQEVISDGLGRPIQTKSTVPSSTCSSGYSYLDATYDNEGRKFSLSNPYCTTGDATYGLTKTYYDALDRPILVVPPDGTTPTSSVTCLTNDVCMSYTAACTTVTDQASKSRKSCADGLGRVTSVLEDPAGLNYQTSYSYDALGNLLSVTQSGSRQRTFAYDSLSRLVTAINPESGSVCYATYSGGACTNQNGYDANGNLVTKTDARGITTNYVYDAMNRLAQKSYTDSTHTVSYSYDGIAPTNCTVSFSYGSYAKSRRTAMCDAAGNEAWSYDGMGRVAQDQRTSNGVTKTTTYSTQSVPYNYDGSVAQLTYPSGRAITYTPNSAGQPVSAVDVGSNVSYATLATYLPNGAPSTLVNGVNIISTWYYTNRLLPCRIAVTTTGTAPNTCTDSTNTGNVLDLTYSFNSGISNNGNVAGIVNNRDATRSQVFGYDTLNRLSTGQTVSTNPTHCWGESFVYDQFGGPSPWGNLVQINAVSSAYNGCTQESLSITVDSNNRINTSGFSYDNAGNLIAGPFAGYTYTYSAEEQMTEAVTTSATSYVYDGDGKRVEKTSGGTVNKIYWYGMNDDPLAESDGSGNTTDEYIFFHGKRIAHRVGQ